VRFAITSLVLLAISIRSAAVAQSPGYPATRRDTVVADYHGIKVADPYRWLERLDDPATKAWIESQSRLTREGLDRLPGRDAIGRRLESLWRSSRTEVPWREAGRLFYLENPGGRWLCSTPRKFRRTARPR
jgi:prolyl oligopeptidase